MSEITQRGLAAILATTRTAALAADVVGHARPMEPDEAGTHAAMTAHRQTLRTPKVQKLRQ